uniref:Zinc finger PMZ-type domain-containing protein n=1 Tax=Lactuca sativa TaxID=4236 RepID=A0A9R1WTL8_LACSA|nr:hypothetical protein LSAT_V11C100026510 [Lactuca sativa]
MESGDDYDDSEYIVHESNLQFDVNVDMSEFHSVVDVYEHGILNKKTKYLACTSKYLAKLISNPRIPIKDLHDELCKKLELGMSVEKVARAKQMVERVISGDYQLQYGYLRHYALEMQNTNLGTTVRIYVDLEPCLLTTTRTFRRIYVCLGALKLGFKVGLRDFLGVDGEDLELGANSKFTLISDRQNGIIPAVAKVFPNAEHRETTLNHFKYALDDLKKINDEDHSWLCKIPAETLSKSHFSGRAHTDCLLNNLCEVFNAKIDEGRDKPIITCLEYIREYLMKRLCIVKKEIDKCPGELSTTEIIILEEIKTDAAKYVANYNGARKYQVASTFWEIKGFPCRHVMSTIWNKIKNGEDATDVKDWLSTWRAMYLNKTDPINGRSMWPKSDCPFTLTPPKRHTQVVMCRTSKPRTAETFRGGGRHVQYHNSVK